MPNTLAAIGFEFADAEQFQAAMLDLAADSIERLGCPPGEYAIWRSRTGAEIWFHLTLFGDAQDARDIAGLTPFFEGDTAVSLTVMRQVSRSGDNPFEGGLEARIEAPGFALDATVIVLDAVDFAAQSARPMPFAAEARLTAFATTARQVPPATPAGIVAATDRNGAPWCLTGCIVARRRLVNEASARPFEHLVLQVGGVVFDVVCPDGLVAADAGPGAGIELSAVVFGRLLD